MISTGQLELLDPGSSLSIVTKLWDGWPRFDSRREQGRDFFCLRHGVLTDSGAHPDFYPLGSRGSFPGGKAGEA